MRDYEPYYTEDGSIGLYSYRDKDVYHSKFGALTEAWEKFVIPSDIEKLMRSKHEVNVLDICFGIGYNSKALMTFVIEKNKKKISNKNIFVVLYHIVSICINNYKRGLKLLLHSIATIYDNNDLTKFNIDCLDVDKELIKLSPFFKTIKTPEEIFIQIVPDIFNCFKLYYKFKNIFVNLISRFYPHNKKDINDLLNIKFKNMHIEKEYKVNKIVNYILLNRLYETFGKDYYNDDLKNLLKDKKTSKFFDKSYIKYAKFNHCWGYNKPSKGILSPFLHNIYYSHLSKRNKNINFKAAESLFNMTFYIEDARKSIRKINRSYDCIFLDAFTYTKSPLLWTQEFIAELVKKLKDTGVILTYSNSAQIRNTMLENNLYVGKIYNIKAQKFIGTIASKDKSKILYPLNSSEIGLCKTKAGIPYHDPNLAFDPKDILELREYEFKHSPLMSSSSYMKLRNMKSYEQ